jgi:uncharacterized membrane protein YdbT with pleckstrin-like domain
MSYITDSLSQEEKIHKIFKNHGIVTLLIVLNFIIGILTLGIWLIPAFIYWLKWKNTENGVTNKRVIHKSGIISRRTDEMRLKSIESIYIRQGFWGRIFGFGTVVITGRGQGDVILRWIEEPLKAKIEIENAETKAV